MNEEDFKKHRELFFSVRNSLDQPRGWFEYQAVISPEKYKDHPEIVKPVSAGHELLRGKNPEYPLWCSLMNVPGNGLNYKTFEEITKDAAAGLFEFIKADVFPAWDRTFIWTPEDVKEKIFRKIILIPKDKTKYPHEGYIRQRVVADPRDDPEYMKDLRELDNFFGNT